MDDSCAVFENFSVVSEIGVAVLDTSGGVRFGSSLYNAGENFMQTLHKLLDCGEACRVALLYGCYQARRFGGRYIFFAPSGLAYCTSPLWSDRGELVSGAVAGPFLMTDHDEYLEIDVLPRYNINEDEMKLLADGLKVVPYKTPAQASALSEQLYICSVFYSQADMGSTGHKSRPQADAFAATYSIEKEDDLLSAISIGDIQTASSLLNLILGQILFHSGNNLEILRSRVVELTVLLSRAALKGGADPDAIFGLNYGFLREIDTLESIDDIVQWLHRVTRRFAQHVFDFAGARHVDVIYKAIAYIRQNYAEKITLQDVSDHVYMSLSYFCKIFKEETGQTPGGYITAVRIEESKKLLRDLTVSIVDIPERVGFESQSYFTRVFRKAEGYTPGRYRQEILERV